MKTYTKILKVRISEQQYESLHILRKHKVDVSAFVREAIREKIAREWKQIKELNKNKLPF